MNTNNYKMKTTANLVCGGGDKPYCYLTFKGKDHSILADEWRNHKFDQIGGNEEIREINADIKSTRKRMLHYLYPENLSMSRTSFISRFLRNFGIIYVDRREKSFINAINELKVSLEDAIKSNNRRDYVTIKLEATKFLKKANVLFVCEQMINNKYIRIYEMQ